MPTPQETPSNVVAFSNKRARTRPAQDDGVLAQIIAAQGEIAQAGLDAKKVVDIITHRSEALTRSTGAVVEMVQGEDLVYWSASGTSLPHLGLHVPRLGSLSGRCLDAGEVLQCDDSETDPRVNLEACRKVGLRSAIAVPLTCGDHVVGVLKVVSDRAHAYTTRDVATLRTFGTFIGATLHHVLEHARARGLADPVSGNAPSTALDLAQRDQLRAILRSGGLRGVFQPIVELATGAVIGYEGLTRFPSESAPPQGGWFCAAARLGMSEELDLACMVAIVRASADAPRDAYIAVNASPGTVIGADIESVLGADPTRRWVVEITEHAQVEDYALLLERATVLRDRGWRIAVDDAGAGYASLRHVLKLSPDIVKLDITLTRDIDIQVRQRQLASAIVSFARESGITLVAEGIETVEERDTLRALGVACGQGYLFGWPRGFGDP